MAENSLCVLLAKPPQDLPQELGGPRRIPSPPYEVAAGIPADLLRRRPDVLMAEYAAWSHCARIGVAKGELLPSFSLFGSLGFASSHTGNFFDTKAPKPRAAPPAVRSNSTKWARWRIPERWRRCNTT